MCLRIMKKLHLSFVSIFGFAAALGINFLLVSCNDEFKVTTDWKETAIVVGVLDPNDTVHYIKITKAFLDEKRNALEIAKIQDSLYFDPTRTVVTVEAWKNDQKIKTYNPVLDRTIAKDTGIFSAPTQILYKFEQAMTGDFRDKLTEYRLNIKTPNNNTITAKTNVVGDYFLLQPPAAAKIDWSNSNVRVRFQRPENATIYDLKVRIHYQDYAGPGFTNLIATRFVDWNLVKNAPISLNSSFIDYTFRGVQLFAFMRSNIPVLSNLNRRMLGTEFIIATGGKDLAQYISINNSSSNLAQIKLEYTNINNGLGLFSTRNTIPNLKLEMANRNYPLSSPTYFAPNIITGLDSLYIKYPELNFLRQ